LIVKFYTFFGICIKQQIFMRNIVAYLKPKSIQIKNNGYFFRFKSKIMAFIFDLDKKTFLLCG